MRFIPSDRIGLSPEITSFVVHEDDSLEARSRRVLAKAREGLRETAGLARCYWNPAQTVPESAAEADPFPRAEVPAATGAGLEAPKSALLDDLRLRLAALVLHAARIQSFAFASRSLADRLLDGVALAKLVAGQGLRWLWRASWWAKTAIFAGVLLAVAPTPRWPSEVEMARGETTAFAAASPAQAREMADAWTPVSAPLPSYYLEAPELDRMVPKYRARRQASGARQDILQFGDLSPVVARGAKSRPAGAVSIEVYPSGHPQESTLFVDVARRAALVGASLERMSDSSDVLTKFGAFDVADATLSTETGPRTCLVFRHVAESVPVQLHGWFCGAAQKPIDRTALSCILDRVDLLGAGDNTALKAYFAEAELARKSCGSYKAGPSKLSWLDPAGKMPPLKASLPDGVKRR